MNVLRAEMNASSLTVIALSMKRAVSTTYTWRARLKRMNIKRFFVDVRTWDYSLDISSGESQNDLLLTYKFKIRAN